MARALNPQELIQTIETLQRRISERFPDSGLSRVAGDLLSIAQQSAKRSQKISRPYLGLRLLMGVMALGIIGILVLAGTQIRELGHIEVLADLIQVFEAALGSIFFIGAAILFLFTLEIRWKRARALNAIHELRSMAHIVDMHQLTKDPERITSRRGESTPSSPKRTLTSFQLSRYLDYCSELLSLISKVANLYIQRFPDSVALEAVDQVESLTTGLSRGIWQKLMILERVIEQSEREMMVRGENTSNSPPESPQIEP
jgi:hypothetical protein